LGFFFIMSDLLFHKTRRFTLATWNAHGLILEDTPKTQEKLLHLGRWARNVDVFVIQEAHVDVACLNVIQNWGLRHRFSLYYTPAKNGRLGGLILCRWLISSRYLIQGFEIEESYIHGITLSDRLSGSVVASITNVYIDSSSGTERKILQLRSISDFFKNTG